MGKIKSSDLGPITDYEKAMIDAAARQPITYDADCPEMTPEMLSEFKRVSEINRNARRKQVLSIRVSSATLEKAQALGAGYTGVLSRLLEMALNDPEMIKKCL